MNSLKEENISLESSDSQKIYRSTIPLVNIDPSKQRRHIVPQRTEIQEQLQSINSTNKSGYEIRENILELAINYAKRENVCENYKTPESIIELAKQFYSFVENKNR